ncbi:lipocalin family protein [Proteiniphilum acetatigenes]|uniref:lipocalin family protein n=1 Tax=Proteiniphilum acetatigenes TaxID=294710 RepID=UPI00039FEA07|nr:lipocalin family protein [Proteiniphilum acetatigenes]SFL50107.1 apolipoprotein D and lipocalin family protein [Porphyromonadaceae bacterium KH3CP3RA]
MQFTFFMEGILRTKHSRYTDKKQRFVVHPQVNITQWKIVTGAMLFMLALLFSGACTTIPKEVQAVSPFDADKYLGKWYEIARLDFKFERDLNNTTAEYSMNEDGTIEVVNRGYNYVKKEWKEAIGKAKFVESPDIAKLKVSFFGPFYAGYNVAALDKDYRYALVIGKSPKYMWILSRERTIPEDIRKDYIRKAKEIGVKTEELIWVKHDK